VYHLTTSGTSWEVIIGNYVGIFALMMSSTLSSSYCFSFKSLFVKGSLSNKEIITVEIVVSLFNRTQEKALREIMKIKDIS
jgi:hypothetical protein